MITKQEVIDQAKFFKTGYLIMDGTPDVKCQNYLREKNIKFHSDLFIKGITTWIFNTTEIMKEGVKTQIEVFKEVCDIEELSFEAFKQAWNDYFSNKEVSEEKIDSFKIWLFE